MTTTVTMDGRHDDHELVLAGARMARRGGVLFVLCVDCRAIVSEQEVGAAGVRARQATGGTPPAAPGWQR